MDRKDRHVTTTCEICNPPFLKRVPMAWKTMDWGVLFSGINEKLPESCPPSMVNDQFCIDKLRGDIRTVLRSAVWSNILYSNISLDEKHEALRVILKELEPMTLALELPVADEAQ